MDLQNSKKVQKNWHFLIDIGDCPRSYKKVFFGWSHYTKLLLPNGFELGTILSFNFFLNVDSQFLLHTLEMVDLMMNRFGQHFDLYWIFLKLKLYEIIKQILFNFQSSRLMFEAGSESTKSTRPAPSWLHFSKWINQLNPQRRSRREAPSVLGRSVIPFVAYHHMQNAWFMCASLRAIGLGLYLQATRNTKLHHLCGGTVVVVWF